MADYNLYAEIFPELAKSFTADFKAQLSSALASVDAKVKIAPDSTSAAKAGIEAAKLAEKAAPTVKLKADIDNSFLRTKIEKLAIAERAAYREAGQRAGNEYVKSFKQATSGGFRTFGSAVGSLGKLAAAGGPIGIAIGVGLVAALSTTVLTGVGAIATSIVASGVLAGGIALAMKDPAIAASAANTGAAIKTQLVQSAAKGLGPAISSSLEQVKGSVSALGPTIDRIFTRLGPTLDKLATGVSGTLANAAPGLEKIVSVGASVLDTLSAGLPALGSAISDFGNSMEQSGLGFDAFAKDFLAFTSKVIRDTGSLIEGASKLYAVWDTISGLLDKISGTTDTIKKTMDLISPTAPLFSLIGSAITALPGAAPAPAIDTRLLRPGTASNPNPEFKSSAELHPTPPPIPPVVIDSWQQYNAIVEKSPVAKVVDDITSKMAEATAATRSVTQASRAFRDAKEAVTAADLAGKAAVSDAKDNVLAANRAIITAQDGVVHANQRYKDSLGAIKDAQQRVIDSTKALAAAREEARKQIRDSADTQESASIALQRANIRLDETKALPSTDLERRQAVLDQKNAQEDFNDLSATNLTIQKNGVEKNPSVIAAKQAQTGAEKDLAAAYRASQDALRDITTAEQAVTDAVKNKRKAVEGVTAAQLAYTISLRNAKEARGDALQNLKDQTAAATKLKDVLKQFPGTFLAKITADGSDAQAVLRDTQIFLTATRLIAEGQTPAIAQKNATILAGAVVGSNSQLNKVNSQLGFKDGGFFSGGGTDTSDSNLAWLSNNEYIVKAKSAKKIGTSALDYINDNGALPSYAEGGLHTWKGPNLDLSKMHLDKILKAHLPSAFTAILGGVAGTTAGIALATAQVMKASAKQILSLFETGLVESGMKNLASRAVPSSLKLANEGVVPGDHDSIGFLQQRASWGTVASRMNVADSTRRFLHKAFLKDKANQSAGQLAQAVQVSAFPARYDAMKERALALIGLSQLGGEAGIAGSAGSSFTPGYRNQIATLKAAGFNLGFSNSQLTGGVHAPNSWHYPSKHPPGRAIDIGVGTNGQATVEKVWSYLVKNYAKNSQELFWAQKQINYLHGKPTGPHDKANHVHWAYDQGGWMDQLGFNTSGKPEAVLTNAESKGLKAGGSIAGNGGAHYTEVNVAFGDIHNDVDFALAVDRIDRLSGAGI